MVIFHSKMLVHQRVTMQPFKMWSGVFPPQIWSMARTSRIKQFKSLLVDLVLLWFYKYHIRHGINIHIYIWFHMVCIWCHSLIYFIDIIYCIVIQRLVDFPLMSVKQCLKPSPSHHHFHRWYVYHFPAMGGLWPFFSPHCMNIDVL